MRDRSKQLLVINTDKKESEQTRLPAQSGTTHIIGGGGLSANMSDYLLKSIWDKVWEIRTDSQGIEYIFGKLPMVTQYGITMYSGDGVDVPSLASGLPFDGRTIWYNPETQQIEVIGGTGGGSGEGVSNFWDLSGIPSWITNSKPKYTYSEIEGTPDLTQYALVSQIPSLSGYATESWVLQKNYATKATTLSGYGITDAYTKTNVDDLLKSYVTLGGTQTITGEKNFTGGLKVNGSHIYYDTDKKYWKLEGDLLVTGGVTMYGNEGTYTPSTIMDAIAVDGTTISKSGGVLKVIGGTGGGVADSVAWVNITGKPTWIGSSKPTYSYSEITGAISTTELQNYLTSNSYLNVTSGDNRYLLLSGGTISGISGNYTPLIVETKSLPEVWLQFKDTVGNTYIGSDKGQPAVYIEGDRNYLLLHSGNYSSYALPLSGGGRINIWQTGTFVDILNWGVSIGVNVPNGGWDRRYSIGNESYEYANAAFGAYGEKAVNWAYIAIGNQDYNTAIFKVHNDRATILDHDIIHSSNIGEYTIQYYGNQGAIDFDNVLYNGVQYTSGSSVNGGKHYGVLMSLWSGDTAWQIVGGRANEGLMYRSGNGTSTSWSAWKTIAFTDSNVSSATKLQTARTIWGQSFDGTGNVDGLLSINGVGVLYSNGVSTCYVGSDSIPNTYISGGNINLRYGTKIGLILNSSGNVGIGTTSPTKKLHIYDSNINNNSILLLEKGNAYDSRLDLINSVDSLSILQHSTGNAFISLRGNHSLIFETSNSARVTIDSSGSVGIGTQNPSKKLHIYSDSSSHDSLVLLENGGAYDVRFELANSIDALRVIQQASGNAFISLNGNHSLNLETSNTVRFTIDGSGNVGIGTTNPQQKLHVEGHIWANGDIAAMTKIHAFGNLIADGNVGIGTESPSAKLHIVNNTNTSTGLRLDGGWSGYGFLYNEINIFLNGEQYGGIGVNTVSSAYGSTAAAGTYITNAKSGEYMNFYNEGGTFLKSSLLVNGGITMYSDQRKKTILSHVELSLKQIANAPLIEHYYNGDEKKTTHVGSIAQYWANMNDWFCKLDSEGYYTMEIQNAALASAISIARELDRYETKTDKAIKKLKKRICELEEEVERLKSA